MGHRNPSTLVLADIRREAGVLEQFLRQHRFHPLTWHRRVESHDGMDDRAPFLGTRRDGPTKQAVTQPTKPRIELAPDPRAKPHYSPGHTHNAVHGLSTIVAAPRGVWVC